jgi:S-adenosylmethionine hydrolase
VNSVVSLITDFGLTEPFVGLVKAQLLARHPGARIVDLTHGIPPFSTEAAAFWIERSCRYFPPGSLHLVIVDPGVGTDRRILTVELDGQTYLGPDNGVLGPLAGTAGARVRAVDMGSLAGALSSGDLAVGDLGLPCEDWVRPGWLKPQRVGASIHGRVILIDSFGNCFSNIDEESLVKHEIESVNFGTHRLSWVRTYGERPAGSAVALVNAFGVVEAACVEGNAARSLGLAAGAAVEVRLGRATAAAKGRDAKESTDS